MSDSPESSDLPLLTNLWAKESAVNSVPRPTCDCLNAPFDGRWRHELSLHNEQQDKNCRGWLRLLELIDQAAADGRDVFSPSREMHPNEWAQIVTLPPSISKLKAVKHFILYGSSLVRIPPEIGEMSSLENFTPYTSYRLHWFPYEITKCTKLVDSTVSTRAIYGNFKNRLPFPRLPQLLPDAIPRRCSVCDGPFQNSPPRQAWISLAVATDVLPLLVHACSEVCLNRLPAPPDEYYKGPHSGGLELDQPSPGYISAKNIRRLLNNGGYKNQGGSLPRPEALTRALIDAAENGHLQLAGELIAEGADLNASADPLIAACESFNLRILEYLVSQSADINGCGTDAGETPLMAAAGVGFVDGVLYLLMNGADVARHDKEGMDARDWAKMGAGEDNFLDGIPDDARDAFAKVIEMLETHGSQEL